MPSVPINDPSTPQPQPGDADQSAPQQTVQNTPATTVPVQPQSSTQNTPATSQPQPVQNGQQQPSQTTQLWQNNNQSGTVSNTTAPVHPAVQRAGILRQVATALAGGDRYTTSIDPNTGATTRTRVPLSSKDIGMAIAVAAITGALSGLSVTGPAATARAASAGFQQTQMQMQQVQQQQDQQAQQNFENQSNQLARRASIYEANSRAILNVSEAEQRGADAIDKLTDINRASGVLDVDADLLDNGGTPMTQAELLDSMKAGKLSPTDALGPVAGRVEVTNPDGSKRWEATHLVIKDPNAPTTLTQEDWDRYAEGGVQGFPKGTKIGAGVQIPLRMKVTANEQLASHYLANQRLDDLRNVLDGTDAAKQVPTSIDFTKPGVNAAMQQFQRYVSHDAANLSDPYTALQQMGQAKRDPKTGEVQPNPDAKYVDTVASAFGGWPVLEAAHDQLAANKKTASDFAIIDTEPKAQAVLSAPKRFSKDQVAAATNFLRIAQSESVTKASAEARARAIAEGKDQEAMYRTGVNPITKERLTLDNAPDSMFVDAKGNVVPTNEQTFYKPTQAERGVADTARQALAISSDLRNAVRQNPALIGPLLGRSKAGLAKLGLGDAQAQTLLNNIGFLTSAATKVHTAGRFSNQVLTKMADMIKPNMNVAQFNGALNSFDAIMGRYAKEDQLITVGDLKSMQTEANVQGSSQAQRPAGATMTAPGSDGKMHWTDGHRDLGVVQ